VDKGAGMMSLPHMNWFFYLARICNHCTYPACLASCPRGSIYKRPEDGIVLVDQGRCRGYQECVKGCPYKKVFFNPMTGTSEKCIACYPKIEQGEQPQCVVSCIGRIRMVGFISPPGVIDLEICADTGAQPGPDCPNRRPEVFEADQPPPAAP